jgi:alpha-ketoglutarate-dependent 2,4-dichlorophenoxyacetate dioxygenase
MVGSHYFDAHGLPITLHTPNTTHEVPQIEIIGTMTITSKPLHPLFAAELSGIDLSKPISDDQVRGFQEAMNRYGVGVIRHASPFTDTQHVEFTRRLGPLQKMKMLTMVGNSKSRLAYPELIDVGNIDNDGNLLPDDDRRRAYGRGNLLWHTDVSFDANRATLSLLAAHQIPPEGADTEFADMRAAYDALPEAMKKKIASLKVEHSIWYSRALAGMSDVSAAEQATRPPTHHDLVHVHPGSGRRVLYLAAHASHIVGWPIKEGRAFLAELTAHATQPQFVFRHQWRLHDLLVWDNLATMHRATPFDDTRYARDMRRTTVLEYADD